MKAVAYKKASPIDHPESLLNVEVPIPHATRRDLLIELQAVSVNPVDVKLRTTVAPNADEYQILGRNASGVDKEVGPEASYSSPETKRTALAPLHVPAQTLSIQAAAADLQLLAFQRAYGALLQADLPVYLINFIHDELVLEVREDVVEDVRELLVQVQEMTQAFLDLFASFRPEAMAQGLVEVGKGQNYAETKQV
jgi:hypothetical protein